MSMRTSDGTPTSNIPTGTPAGVIPGPVKTMLAVLVTTAFVMMLNETTVAVALPSIMDDFSILATTGQWLLTGFLLTMAVVLPATGWVLDRFSTRSVFFFATLVFLVGTIVAAIAPTFFVMLLARVAQAVGTAVIMPLLMTVAMKLVPAQRRGMVMGLIGVVMAVAPALGPTVAGFVLTFTGWHGIFWVMVPLVGIATVVGAFKLENIGAPKATSFDVLSMILSVFAFGGLVYGLSSIDAITKGETVPLIILAVGVAGLGLFVWRQLAASKRGKALLDLRPLAVRNFTLSLIVMMGLFAALLGVMNTLPLYLQGSLLVTALVTGLVLLPGGLVEGALSPIAGRLFDRFGPRPLIVPSMVIAMGSLSWLSTVNEQSSPWIVVAIHVLFSVGLAGLFTPVMTTALGSLPSNLYGHGSAIFNTLQQLAGAAGTALMISIYSNVSARAVADGATEVVAEGQGASFAFFVSAIVAVVAFVFSLFIQAPPVGKADVQTVQEGGSAS